MYYVIAENEVMARSVLSNEGPDLTVGDVCTNIKTFLWNHAPKIGALIFIIGVVYMYYFFQRMAIIKAKRTKKLEEKDPPVVTREEKPVEVESGKDAYKGATQVELAVAGNINMKNVERLEKILNETRSQIVAEYDEVFAVYQYVVMEGGDKTTRGQNMARADEMRKNEQWNRLLRDRTEMREQIKKIEEIKKLDENDDQQSQMYLNMRIAEINGRLSGVCAEMEKLYNQQFHSGISHNQHQKNQGQIIRGMKAEDKKAMRKGTYQGKYDGAGNRKESNIEAEVEVKTKKCRCGNEFQTKYDICYPCFKSTQSKKEEPAVKPESKTHPVEKQETKTPEQPVKPKEKKPPKPKTVEKTTGKPVEKKTLDQKTYKEAVTEVYPGPEKAVILNEKSQKIVQSQVKVIETEEQRLKKLLEEKNKELEELKKKADNLKVSPPPQKNPGEGKRKGPNSNKK